MIESLQQSLAKIPLSTVPLIGKRAAQCERNNDNRKLLSPGKRAKLDLAGVDDGEISEKVTKVADSPVNVESVKEQPIICNHKFKTHMDNAIQSEGNEPYKSMDIKLEQECTEKETTSAHSIREIDLENEKKEVKLSHLEDKECCSQVIGRLDSGGMDDQHELPVKEDGEQVDPSMQVMFSDEEDEGGATSTCSPADKGRMLSSQMNRQIDRVQLFLKLERLKRPKK